MEDALIGHTGFVGSNLQRQRPFAYCFNSQNFDQIRGGQFDLLVCAGIQAKKWWANQHPEEDWAGIERLLDVLATVSVRRFVLISTVDVYPGPTGVTESTPITEPNHIYGWHRLKVEQFVREKFADSYVLRLPGLFGKGLKKNVIFDLLRDNCLEQVNPNSVYQYYWLGHLWRDIQQAIKLRLPLLNVSTEPVPTSMIIERYFPEKRKWIGEAKPFCAAYDMRSDHWREWGGRDGYHYTRESVVGEIGEFIESENATATG